jgi:RNA polymerase sigma factor (TIGR02999 family)
MDEDPTRHVYLTEMLKAWGSGDADAANTFMPLVYDELRRQAHNCLRGERPNHTLQSGALVHEAYLRLAELGHITWQNRRHFYWLAAQMMRRILVNYAVKRSRGKRGGKDDAVPLDENLQIRGSDRPAKVLELDEALSQLAELDEQQARIVELRYFGGLSINETADVLNISPATVKRDWAMAKSWLRSQLSESSS